MKKSINQNRIPDLLKAQSCVDKIGAECLKLTKALQSAIAIARQDKKIEMVINTPGKDRVVHQNAVQTKAPKEKVPVGGIMRGNPPQPGESKEDYIQRILALIRAKHPSNNRIQKQHIVRAYEWIFQNIRFGVQQ